MAVTLGGLSITNPLALPTPNTGVGVLAPGRTAITNSYGDAIGVAPLPGAPSSKTPAAAQPGGSQTPPTTQPTPTTTASNSTASNYQDKSNDITMQQAGMNSAGSARDTGINTVQDALDRILGRYASEGASAQKEYGSESTANQQDLQNNKQQALETAVRGRQGLFGTLASLGALSGTGVDLANRAVQEGANQDLTTAADTFATNQNSLDSSYNNFNQQNEERKAQAQQNAANDEKQVRNDYFKAMQTYLTNLANDYTAEGNKGQAKTYADQAAALFPQISGTNVPQVDIGYSGSAYTAPTLASYLGRANNTTVQSTPASTTNNIFGIPGLVAANKKAA